MRIDQDWMAYTFRWFGKGTIRRRKRRPKIRKKAKQNKYEREQEHERDRERPHLDWKWWVDNNRQRWDPRLIGIYSMYVVHSCGSEKQVPASPGRTTIRFDSIQLKKCCTCLLSCIRIHSEASGKSRRRRDPRPTGKQSATVRQRSRCLRMRSRTKTENDRERIQD